MFSIFVLTLSCAVPRRHRSIVMKFDENIPNVHIRKHIHQISWTLED